MFKILYKGLAPSALGDLSHQIILQVSDNLGVSILGPTKRSDASYGLPNVEDAEYSGGVEETLNALMRGHGSYAICPLRFTTSENVRPGDTVRGETPPYRIIAYKGWPDISKKIDGKHVLKYIKEIRQNGEKGVIEKYTAENLRNDVYGYLIKNPQLFLVKVVSGWERANPNPRTSPAGVIWSLCAPVFLGTYGNPTDRKAHVYGLLCYKNANGYTGWIAVTKNGCICQESNYTEVPITFLNGINKPPEWEEFTKEARTFPGWTSSELILPD